MVWASHEPVDDSTPAIDSVRAKPLKKRCSSRAGLSRYYSSKSQSFSSLNLVQCTPFGSSAMALAKRPASFDLRRGGSPRPRLSHVTAAFVHSDKEINMSIPDEDDGGKDSEQEAPDRCPCNDTIFSDPTEAFMSPEGSPNTSSLQMYDSCGLSDHDIGSYQQQRQYQLTSEYLTHLSTLLPIPLPSPSSTNGGGAAAAGGGGSTRSSGLSSVLSSGCCGKTLSTGSSNSSSSSVGGSYCDSSMASTARLWQLASAHIATSYSAGLDRPDCHVTGGSSGVFSRAWPQYPGPGPISSLEAVTQTLLQSCGDDMKIMGAGSGCGRTVNISGTGASYPLASQTTAFGASSSAVGSGILPRNCRTSSGYLYPVLHGSGSAAMSAVTLGSSAPTPMVTTPTSMVPATDASHANGSGSSANGAVPALGRKLAMGGITHRRLRAAQAAGLVAVHSARHAAAGLWGSTEDMIASLTLSDKQLLQQQQQHQPQQHLLGSRPPAPSSVALVGDGTCW
ncbi:hypothetical protein VaNZ11_008843 [Volvox africanus]|uniref:Uncharacterized protein n=1 Tax=Volvox africanus TaxID=51714 RepID=A0ABQ5S7X0_9CHLO|nr:hypothetical protein VaNZ11_008843 [Volvox africanus]